MPHTAYKVSNDWDDCKTELERRLYLIKNMENLNKNSKPYLTGEYDEMFNAAEMASMAAEDIVACGIASKIKLSPVSLLALILRKY